MDQQRILCTYLNHAPTGYLTPSTLQVIPTLIHHAHNPEGLARSLVATINRHLFVLQDSLSLHDLDIEHVQNYWSNISMMDCLEGESPEEPSDSRVHQLLSTAYNEVVFAWVTDFLLYPISKRVPQLIPRVRNNRLQHTVPIPIPHNVIQVVDPINIGGPEQDIATGAIVGAPADAAAAAVPKRRYPLPRRTPPQPATATGVEEEEADDSHGLDGCKFINREEDEEDEHACPPSPVSTILSRTNRKRKRGQEESLVLEDGLAQWNAADSRPLGPDEELYGEALLLRTGRYREILKRDIYRRDGASCAASAIGPTTTGGLPDEPLFCTQIIPESADTDRFTRFRKMVSVVFAGQYDDLLAPPSSSPSPSSSSSSSSSSSLGSAYAEPEQMEMDHSAAPVQRRRTHQARHSRVENILRSPRNALNLSEKWLRWFDEGRFVIREWGGQFYIRCLDPSLYHDPSFSRQGLDPNDPWERGHGLRLDIGATPVRVGVVNMPPSHGGRQHQRQHRREREPAQRQPQPGITGTTTAGTGNTLPPYHHQLPTPVPTPTSPAPISPFPELPPPLPRFGFGPTARQASVLPITVRGPRHLPRLSHHRQGNSLSALPSSRRPQGHQQPGSMSTSTAMYTTPAHAHAASMSLGDSSGPVMQHPQLREPRSPREAHDSATSPRHPGPFVAGQASRRAYQHSRNTSMESTTAAAVVVAPSRHSIKALLNPASSVTTLPPLPPSVISSVASAHGKMGISTYLPPITSYSPPAPVSMPARKELWDVDALDPRLTRLHEQIVSMWWATGLPTEIAAQNLWMERMPLQEMNVFVLGEQMFAAVLQHKLKLI